LEEISDLLEPDTAKIPTPACRPAGQSVYGVEEAVDVSPAGCSWKPSALGAVVASAADSVSTGSAPSCEEYSVERIGMDPHTSVPPPSR
jgi:hypothetical protein